MPHRLLVLSLLPLSGPAAAAPLPRPPQADPAIADRLAAGVVADVPPRVVYTWTTAAQIARLRSHRMLLTRTESPESGQTNYALRLAQHAEHTDSAVSALLSRPGFARHRYAWHQPWATAAGWGEETYGDALIAVELKDEAWMGIFDTRAEQPWRFVDMAGRPVRLEQVLASPERIGLILNIKPESYEPHPVFYTFGWTSPPYREYILCNEAMIKRWSHGGAAMQETLAESRDLLTELRPHLPPQPDATSESALAQRWRQPASSDVVDLYIHNLALTGPAYWPGQVQIDALIARLSAIPDSAALSHTPDFTFSLDAPPPIPGGVP